MERRVNGKNNKGWDFPGFFRARELKILRRSSVNIFVSICIKLLARQEKKGKESREQEKCFQFPLKHRLEIDIFLSRLRLKGGGLCIVEGLAVGS